MCGFSPNRRKWKRRQREKRSRNNWRIFFLLTWVRSRGRSPRNQGGGEGPGRFQGQSLRERRPEFQRPEPQRQDYDLPPFLLRRVGPRGDPQHKDEDSTQEGWGSCMQRARRFPGEGVRPRTQPRPPGRPHVSLLVSWAAGEGTLQVVSDTDFWLFPYRNWRNHFLGGVMLRFPCM